MRVRTIAIVAASLLVGGLLATAGPAVASQVASVFISNDVANPIPVAPTPIETQNLAFGSFDFSGTVHGPMVIDEFAVDGDTGVVTQFASRVYEVATTHLRISVLAVGPGNTARQVGDIAVWGRTG